MKKSDVQKILDEHFMYHQEIFDAYAKRNESESFYKRAREACLKQINISELAKVAFLSDGSFGYLPQHHGYKQFTIILEKEGNYEEAINVAQKAKNQGWDGDWDIRILRYKKKIQIEKDKI